MLIAQFIKRGEYSEITALERFSDLITVAQFGRGRLIVGNPPSECIEKAHVGLECVKSCILSRNYDVVILEEASVALTYGFLSVKDILEIIDLKPDNVELVITGRGAPPEVIEKADLVTEMKPRLTFKRYKLFTENPDMPHLLFNNRIHSVFAKFIRDQIFHSKIENDGVFFRRNGGFENISH